MSRVYVALLPEYLRCDVLDAVAATAVTQELCDEWALGKLSELYGEDLELAEAIAFEQAALLSLLEQHNSDCPRRVVASVDVSVEDIRGGELPGKVALKQAITWDDIICYHVDEPEAQQALVDYLQVLEGTQGAKTTSQDYELGALPPLLWFDAQEKDEVVSLLGL